jgi:hypothetical protein
VVFSDAISCGFSPVVTIDPSASPQVNAGGSFSFNVTLTSLDPPGCPPLQSYHINCFPDDQQHIHLQADPTMWLTGPLVVGQPLHGVLSATSDFSTPSGSYNVTCSSGDLAKDAHATLVVVAAPPPSACLPAPPPSTGLFGGGIGLSPFTSTGAGLTPPTVTLGTSKATFQVHAAPGLATDPAQAWVAFGFRFSSPLCLDAGTFSGISFVLTGDVGTCGLTVSALTKEDTAPSFYPPAGTCMMGCAPPSSHPIGLGMTTVPFTDFAGGQPMSAVDPMSLVGFQWTLALPTDPMAMPCVADLVLDQFALVP